MTQSFTVTKLGPAIGAEIGEIDLSRPLEADTVADLRQALLDNLVLFFHDQELEIAEHKEFGRYFGDLHIHPRAPSPEGHPELLVIHADEKSKRVAGQGWHTDVSCDREPPMASILRMTEVPADGAGDTIFASMYAAYEALSDTMQGFLSGLSAVHESAHVYRGRFYSDAKAARDEQPSNEHPIVRTHPETGRRALYVNSGFTTRIVGMNREESRALLDFLFGHIERPDFQVRFRWRPNSIAFWDNRCTQHLAVWDYYPQVRHGVRVTIAGDQPFFRASESGSGDSDLLQGVAPQGTVAAN